MTVASEILALGGEGPQACPRISVHGCQHRPERQILVQCSYEKALRTGSRPALPPLRVPQWLAGGRDHGELSPRALWRRATLGSSVVALTRWKERAVE